MSPIAWYQPVLTFRSVICRLGPGTVTSQSDLGIKHYVIKLLQEIIIQIYDEYVGAKFRMST